MSLWSRIARRLRPPRPPALPDAAWYDLPGAEDEVERRAHTDADLAILRAWVRDGYAQVDGVVPHDLIDAMVGDLDELFTGDEVRADIALNDLVLAGGHRALTDHGDLMALDRTERLAIRDRSNWRIHGFFAQSDAANRIRELPELRRIASMILGVDSHAPYSINFHNGSTQTLHEDSAVFHLGVPNLICGAWIACEDVLAGSGPLVYYPGSHRRPMFERFDDYPYTNLRTATPEVSGAYRHHVDDTAERYERHTFLARKGDVLFWHGMLIHGGEPIRDPALTRRSFVVHFIPEGADVASQITGPTNW